MLRGGLPKTTLEKGLSPADQVISTARRIQVKLDAHVESEDG